MPLSVSDPDSEAHARAQANRNAPNILELMQEMKVDSKMKD